MLSLGKISAYSPGDRRGREGEGRQEGREGEGRQEGERGGRETGGGERGKGDRRGREARGGGRETDQRRGRKGEGRNLYIASFFFQMIRNFRKPLILFSPKILLRLPVSHCL